MINPLPYLSKNEKNVFYNIVIVFLLFYIVRIGIDLYLIVDSYEYLDVAKAIRENLYFNGYGSRDNNFTRRPLIYPLFLSLLLNLKYGAIVFIQMVIVLLSIFNLFIIAKKKGLIIDHKLALFIILTPSIFYYSHVVLADWIVFCLLNLLFYILLFGWSKKIFMAIQIISLFLAFTKPVFYPFIYINFILFCIYLIKIKTFSIWLFVPIIILQLFLNFNQKKTGVRSFSSIENYNLCYNIASFKMNSGSSDEEAWTWFNETIRESKKEATFKMESDYLRNIALTEIKNSWFKYSIYHAGTAIRGIIDPGIFDFKIFYKKNEPGIQYVKDLISFKLTPLQAINNKYLIFVILFIPITIANIIKYFFLFWFMFKSKHSLASIYLLLIIFYYVFITGAVNSTKYMMPLQGVVILFALLGLQNFRKRNEIKRNINV
jgi:hypothetical protein